MFERILGKSEKMLKFFVKIQCFFSFVVAVIVFGAVFNPLSRVSTFAAFVLGVVSAVIVWFMMMGSAWAMYAFADLVEYTKSTHEEISQMSAGLAEYTRATNQTLNTISSDLYVIAKHYDAKQAEADSETAQEEPAHEEAAEEIPEETPEETTNKEDN